MSEFCKVIQLNLGSRTMELQMTQKMVDDIVTSYGLSGPDEITERHVKYYLVNGMRNALETVSETVAT